MLQALKTIEIPHVRKVHSGKVREIFDAGEALVLVATDRLSAFDVVFSEPIPSKGEVLTKISSFWFSRMQAEDICRHHLLTDRVEEFPKAFQAVSDQLKGRSMLVRRCKPLPIECVVRGYLAGSGLKDYRSTGRICGISLPSGLVEADPLPEPIFTPSTKAKSGHDENISMSQAADLVGNETASRVQDLSLRLYSWAADFAKHRGLILCDTKFEFGWDGDELFLIDEALTPDSSRYWPADRYSPGGPQPSFDKQFVRDYLESLDWDKTPPPPPLPPSIIRATSERYLEAHRRLTGREL